MSGARAGVPGCLCVCVCACVHDSDSDNASQTSSTPTVATKAKVMCQRVHGICTAAACTLQGRHYMCSCVRSSMSNGDTHSRVSMVCTSVITYTGCDHVRSRVSVICTAVIMCAAV
eukprot:1154054-Pelagomonas_calceolata.AAC.5